MLWERLAELLAHGDAVIRREADREIQVKDDALRAWLRERQAAVEGPDSPPSMEKGGANGAIRDLGETPGDYLEQLNGKLTA